MATSMILRFRDLAGPIGSTISSHQDIAKERGSVWWAWWNKPSEKVPRDLFAQLKQQIKDRRFLDVYLADSGRYLFYRVRIIDIREADTEEPIKSPDPDNTPQYYLTVPYKAWFKFETIEEVPADKVEQELHKWSYDEVPGFTDDPFFSSYQDKRIFNLEEVLHRRHRTIYFIQPYKPEHKIHLVETLPRVQPQNFIREPIVARSSFILHLSDLHFGTQHGFATSDNEPGKRSLARLIIDDLMNEVKMGPPAAVIISGDITWQANKEEFELSLSFIDRLRSEFLLEPYQFVVVPGNHDIRWVEDPSKRPSQAERVKFPPKKAKKNFHDFYLKLFGIPPNDFFSQGRRLLLSNYVTVDIIGLNSSELEQSHFSGYGYVKAEQLQAAVKEAGWGEVSPRTTYRVLMLHHHLIPVVPEEEIKGYDKNYSITLDAGHIIHECLVRGVDMVIHGHQHQPFTGAIMRAQGGKKFSPDRPLVVNAAGSAGVKKEHIGCGKNFYTIYNFDSNRIEVRLRMKSDADIRFAEADAWAVELVRSPSGGLILKSKS
jgi:3',5'-cyclic AMP phosphodiesterase CpdA